MTTFTPEQEAGGKESLHTPGPWKVYEEVAIDYRPCEIYGANDSQVAWLSGGGRKRAIGKPEERANARLIAAAPELLEACQLAIMTFTNPDVADERREKCRAAIRKATSVPSGGNV